MDNNLFINYIKITVKVQLKLIIEIKTKSIQNYQLLQFIEIIVHHI